MEMSEARRGTLHRALEAAREAGNPYLYKSILRAIEGNPVTLREVMEEPFWIDESSPD